MTAGGAGGAAAAQVRTGTLKVPGATLYYEVRGSGPVLLMIPGGASDAGVFGDIAPVLADRYTVVSYDPRGLSRSTLEEPLESLPVSMQAEDAHRLLAALGTEPAYVLGSSGGALTGLDLVAAHPEQVHTLVAHEPPAVELLPDRDVHRAQALEVSEIYEKEGPDAAMARFMANAGLDGGEQAEAGPPEGMSPAIMEMMGRIQGNFPVFLGPMWKGMVGYLPDFARLEAASSRVVVAVGEASRGQLAHQAALALAERLGTGPVVFPGDHGGFGSHPRQFADQLHQIFQGG